MVVYTNGNQKKVKVAILTDKTDFKTNTVTRNKGLCIITKR